MGAEINPYRHVERSEDAGWVSMAGGLDRVRFPAELQAGLTAHDIDAIARRNFRAGEEKGKEEAEAHGAKQVAETEGRFPDIYDEGFDAGRRREREQTAALAGPLLQQITEQLALAASTAAVGARNTILGEVTGVLLGAAALVDADGLSDAETDDVPPEALVPVLRRFLQLCGRAAASPGVEVEDMLTMFETTLEEDEANG